MLGEGDATPLSSEEKLNQVMKQLAEQSKLIAQISADAVKERKAAEAQGG